MDLSLDQTINRLTLLHKESGNTTWNIPKETGMFLAMLIHIHKAKHILEIGTSTGYSALWLGKGAQKTGGKVTTIESHKERFQTAKINITEAGMEDTIQQVFGHAPEIFPSIEGTFDFIFFDATKEEHLSYIKALEPRLAPQTIIVTDNALSHTEALAPFKAYMEQKTDVSTVCLPLGTGLLISYYNNASLA